MPMFLNLLTIHISLNVDFCFAYKSKGKRSSEHLYATFLWAFISMVFFGIVHATALWWKHHCPNRCTSFSKEMCANVFFYLLNLYKILIISPVIEHLQHILLRLFNKHASICFKADLHWCLNLLICTCFYVSMCAHMCLYMESQKLYWLLGYMLSFHP